MLDQPPLRLVTEHDLALRGHSEDRQATTSVYGIEIPPPAAFKRDLSRPRVSSNGLWLLATESCPHVLGHQILDFESLARD